MVGNIKIELPEVIDEKHYLARHIEIIDSNRNVISHIKSLNTKTGEAETYVLEEGSSRLCMKPKTNPDGTFVTEKVILKNVIIKFRE